MPSPPTTSIPLPPVPPLSPGTWDTNTLALLLPHQALFAPAALRLLRDAFAAYGHLAHWAPVRAMGRVIVVYTEDEAAQLAKREGDGLALHVDLDEPEKDDTTKGRKDTEDTEDTVKDSNAGEKGYFHRRKRSSNDIVLRVFALPRTPLDAGPDHLRPPEAGRNFLISPPGSPPEGWEPIEEEGPNMAPLADDLRRALEALQLTARRGKEVILDEGGVRVEVENTEREEEREWEDGWGEEEVQGAGEGIWEMPSQDRGPALAFDNEVVRRGPLTPSGRIMPTARPPM